ncbi:MAG: glycosyltransferase N-terminal domain-containing protein, partial [Negativicoccus succinicivorans]|nr:glycosyltransferase N-terminal domain-containing protein [Negativicoccus succinicivorans]
MYWFYNICLVLYWLLLVPVLIYRLLFEEGFYDRLRQSAGVMPQPVLTSIENCRGIWVHAASVGEIVAASPIVRELKQRLPDETVIVSVVTATGHRMAERI